MTESVPVQHKAQEIGDRLKALERLSEGEVLPPDKPFIVRLDGHGFSKFTRGFQKPIDEELTQAMIATAEDLMTEFQACCAFTESDEITLVFPPISNPGSTLIYNGRKQKICSLTAGYASARFNYWLAAWFSRPAQLLGDRPDLLRRKLGLAYFDARIFSTSSPKEAMEAVYWRYKYDTFRNGVSGLAQTVFSAKEMHKKSVGEIMAMLKEKGVMLTDQNPHLLYGTFLKKKLVQVQGFDPKKQENVMVTRGQIFMDQVKMDDLSEDEKIDFVMRRYW